MKWVSQKRRRRGCGGRVRLVRGGLELGDGLGALGDGVLGELAGDGAASVAASRRSEPRHQSRTPHRPQPVAIALSRSTKTPSRTPSDPLAGMLTVAVPMGV